MQEEKVTVFGTEYPLEPPFIVLATQNPLEMEGTYPLPEAQIDRFFFKLMVKYPSPEQLVEIIDKTTEDYEPNVNKIIDSNSILQMRTLVKHAVDTYLADVYDPLPESLRRKVDLMPLPDAIRGLHFPEDAAEAENSRKRLAFDEVLVFQTLFALSRLERGDADTGKPVKSIFGKRCASLSESRTSWMFARRRFPSRS